MKIKIFKLFSAGVVLLSAHNAFALAGFSRACRWSEIPRSLEAPALLFFDMISEAPVGKFNYLFNALQETRDSAFILESLTVDYGSARYYLYAENTIYRWVYGLPRPGYNTGFDYQNQGYMNNGGSSSPGWRATALSDLVLSEPRLDIFMHNRRYLYSARAGHPEIIQQLTKESWEGPIKMKVEGRHAYFEPVQANTYYLPNSVAYSCNLGQWGFEAR